MSRSDADRSRAGKQDDVSELFRLEDAFEDVVSLFQPSKVGKASHRDVLIAVDTNVLLLPYTLRQDGLVTLKSFYETLRSEKRLFLPARVAREFISNRDTKLAELLKMLGDVKSRINIGQSRVSPILEGVDGSEEMVAASQALTEAKKRYTSALETVEATVQGWSGDDPITSMYNAVFDSENIISPTDCNEDLSSEWGRRLRQKVPPGYKDGSKGDTGVGDFLIWKSLLALGSAQQKDLIFVTGEEKADWFVRSNNRGAYPRPELIAEYRKHSGGKNIRLVELHEVLRELEAPAEVVTEIENAEFSANNVIRVAAHGETTTSHRQLWAVAPLRTKSLAKFRTNYGGQRVNIQSDGVMFSFEVSEGGEGMIWVYTRDAFPMTKLSGGLPGKFINTAAFNAEPETFRVGLGEVIWSKSLQGYMLLARLVHANMPERSEPFEVDLEFAVYAPGDVVSLP